LREQGSEGLLGPALIELRTGGEAHGPVRRRLSRSGLGHAQGVSRRKRADVPIEGARGRYVPVREVEREGFGVSLAGHAGIGEERLDLGSEREELGPIVVEERLLPRAIPGEEELLPLRVPEGEREHAVEGAGDVLSALLVEVKDHLAVALALEAMARLELLPELLEVVDLPVEDEPEGPVLVRHRLAGGLGEVDD